jgi:hypothetical protein
VTPERVLEIRELWELSLDALVRWTCEARSRLRSA